MLNPLIAEYDSYFTANAPYEQLTLGGMGDTLAGQAALGLHPGRAVADRDPSETGGVITIANAGTGTVSVPVTAPPGTTMRGSPSL